MAPLPRPRSSTPSLSALSIQKQLRVCRSTNHPHMSKPMRCHRRSRSPSPPRSTGVAIAPPVPSSFIAVVDIDPSHRERSSVQFCLLDRIFLMSTMNISTASESSAATAGWILLADAFTDSSPSTSSPCFCSCCFGSSGANICRSPVSTPTSTFSAIHPSKKSHIPRSCPEGRSV